jgi:hypothetical protein
VFQSTQRRVALMVAHESFVPPAIELVLTPA